MANINYTLKSYNKCKDCYAKVLEMLGDSQGKKFTFYSKNIATGQRNLINISDVRFEINKSLAHVLNRQKDHHGCIKAASAALADNPNSVKVQVIKTLALMRTKNWSKCLDCAKSLQKFCEESDKKLSIIDVMDVKSCMAFSYHKLGHKNNPAKKLIGLLKIGQRD